MSIQISPLVTIKQAAAALGVERQSIEDRLESGQLQGKKERVFSKDIWFIYQSEVDSLLTRRKENMFADAPPQTDFSPASNGSGGREPAIHGSGERDFAIPDDVTITTAFAPPPAEPATPAVPDTTLRDQFHLSLRLMSEEFSRCMQASLEHIQDLRLQLRDSESKMLLLTDMERRAAEDRQLIEDKDVALVKAHERIGILQAKIDDLSRPWWKRMFS